MNTFASFIEKFSRRFSIFIVKNCAKRLDGKLLTELGEFRFFKISLCKIYQKKKNMNKSVNKLLNK